MELPAEAHLWMPLCWPKGKTAPAQEVARIVEWARLLLEGDDCEETAESAITATMGGHFAFARAIREDAIPLECIEVLAGVTALAAPRWDESVDMAANAIWTLADPTVQPKSFTAGLPSSDHATYPPLTDDWHEYIFRPTDTEELRGPSTDAWRALVDRAAPIGAGGVGLARIQKDRPVVWHNRHVSPVWECLCAFFDVLAGSQLAKEQLEKLAARAGDAPAILWLAECGLRLAGEPTAASRCAARVDAILASCRYGKNTLALTNLADRRAELASLGRTPSDALLRIGAISREGGVDEEPPSDPGALGDGDLVEIGDIFEEDARERRWARASQGPFHRLFVPDELRALVDPAIEEVMVGFRCVYGLERLHASIAALRTWQNRNAS